MDAFWQDVRYGMRLLTRSPGFTLVTLLVLGLGIGATTTFVSVGDALLLRPLAVREPATLLRAFSGRFSGTSLIDLIEYGRASRTLQGVVPFTATSMSLRLGHGAPESVFGELVGADYFDVVGVPAARGRTFLPTEGRAIGTSPIIVLSHRGWERRFGGDPGVIGREVLLNGQPFTIVGIMPESFTGLYGVLAGDFWVPVAMHPVLFPRSEAFSARGGLYAQAIARMRPGLTIGQVQAELDAIHQRWQRDPAFAERANLVVYPTRMLVPELWSRVAIFVGLLLGLAAMLLCVACLNVASLQLARATARAGEIGIRLAIGAGRGRIVRQLLTESLVLAIGGGILGLALAYGLTHAIGQWRPPTPEPVSLNVSPDWRVLAGTFAIVVMAALLVGLAPAWSAARQAVVASLRQQATRGSGHGRSRLRAGFLVAQVSLSLVLLVVAGLLVRSVGHAQQIDIGFEPDGVLMMRLDLDVRSYTPERGLALYRDLMQQIGRLPGVRGATLADVVPLTGSTRGGDMLKEGTPPPPEGRTDGLIEHVARNDVGLGYFETMRMTRVLGRDFSERDTATTSQVAIVNETFARRAWPRESPLGKRIRMYDSRDPNTPLIEVIGVVRDSKYTSVGEEPRPFMFRPIAQAYDSNATILARVDGDPVAFVPTFREILRQLDPDLPTLEVRAMSEATSISLLPIRIAATFLGALGLVVLALAAIGLYGVLSFLVRLRTKEIGIRMALGADRPRVITTVLRDALRWIAWGVAVGVILALLVTPLAASLLYGVPARDPLTFVGVTLLLIAVGVASCLVPAMRASRVDPLDALRSE